MLNFFKEADIEKLRWTFAFLTPKELFSQCRGVDKKTHAAAIIELCSRQDKESIFYQTLLFCTAVNKSLETLLTPYFSLLQKNIKASMTSPHSSLEHQVYGTSFLSKLLKKSTPPLLEEIIDKLPGPYALLDLLDLQYTNNEAFDLMLFSKVFTLLDDQVAENRRKALELVKSYYLVFSNKHDTEGRTTILDAIYKKLRDSDEDIRLKTWGFLTFHFSHINDKALREKILNFLLTITNQEKEYALALNSLAWCFPHIYDERMREEILKLFLTNLYHDSSEVCLQAMISLENCFPHINKESMQKIILDLFLKISSDYRNDQKASQALISLANCFSYTNDETVREKILSFFRAPLGSKEEEICQQTLDSLVIRLPHIQKEAIKKEIVNAFIGKLKDKPDQVGVDTWYSFGNFFPYIKKQQTREELINALIDKLDGNSYEVCQRTMRALSNCFPHIAKQQIREKLVNAFIDKLSDNDFGVFQMAMHALSECFPYIKEHVRHTTICKAIWDQRDHSVNEFRMTAWLKITKYFPHIHDERMREEILNFFLTNTNQEEEYDIALNSVAECFPHIKDETMRNRIIEVILSKLEHYPTLYPGHSWRTEPLRGILPHINNEITYKTICDTLNVSQLTAEQKAPVLTIIELKRWCNETWKIFEEEQAGQTLARIAL